MPTEGTERTEKNGLPVIKGAVHSAHGAKGYDTVVNSILPELIHAFADQVEEIATPYEIPQVEVSVAGLLPVCEWLKSKGFNYLQDVGGVDYYPRAGRFEVVYHVMAVPQMWRLRLRVMPDVTDPVVPTVSNLWPSADPAEREIYDLFGIKFDGHPNLERILMPHDWEGYPLRRDYPLRGPRELQDDSPPAETNRFHPFKKSEGR